MMGQTYRIDTDHTVADPKLYDPGCEIGAQTSISAGIVSPADVAGLRMQRYLHLLLLPYVLVTPIPLPSAVDCLQNLAQTDASIEYFTMRQLFGLEIGTQVLAIRVRNVD